jgi:hypothetical protein
MNRRARRDVQDPALLSLAHAGQDALRQLKWRAYQDHVHHFEVPLGKVSYGLVVGHRGVVDEHVDWADLTFDRFDQALPIVAL